MSVSQSVGRSVGRSVGQSVGQSVNWSVSQLVSQSVGQSVSQSVRCCRATTAVLAICIIMRLATGEHLKQLFLSTNIMDRR